MLVVTYAITGSMVIVLVSLKPKQHLWMNLFAMIAKDNSKVLNKKNFIAYADSLTMKASKCDLEISYLITYTYSFYKQPLIRKSDSQIAKKLRNSTVFVCIPTCFLYHSTRNVLEWCLDIGKTSKHLVLKCSGRQKSEDFKKFPVLAQILLVPHGKHL